MYDDETAKGHGQWRSGEGVMRLRVRWWCDFSTGCDLYAERHRGLFMEQSGAHSGRDDKELRCLITENNRKDKKTSPSQVKV
jgi:hypothetical protein